VPTVSASSFTAEYIESFHLCHGHPLASPKKRRRVVQQRLDLLLHRLDHLLALLPLLVLVLGFQDRVQERLDLGEIGVDEEIDFCSKQSSARRGVGGGEEMRGEGVGEELGDDAGLGDGGVDVSVVVFDCGDEASLNVVSDACPNGSPILGALEEGLLTGLILRYHSSRGRSRSMMTSSYGSWSSLRAMCARWAHGQRKFVYSVILGARPLVAAAAIAGDKGRVMLS